MCPEDNPISPRRRRLGERHRPPGGARWLPSGHRGLLSALTDRQQEVLGVVVEAGYYEVPQEATQESGARAVITIGQHCR